jgi:ribonuclease HI
VFGKRIPKVSCGAYMKKKLYNSLKKIEKTCDSAELSAAFSQIYDHIDSLHEIEVEVGGDFELPSSVKGVSGSYVIFSDGACRGNPGPGAYGCFAQSWDGEIVFEKAEVFKNTTNNRMELLGVIEGIKSLGSYLNAKEQSISSVKILVVTDSKYVVDGTSKWMDGWKARGWKKADKKSPENVEMWQSLDVLKQKIGKNLSLEWVKGHSGHPQNERCDQLANMALDNEGF